MNDSPTAPEPARRSRTSGIDRALQIFDHLQQVEQATTAYEIARGVGAPLSTIYAIIDDLVEKDLLNRDGNGLIWLGPRLYHYGLTYARNLDLLGAATQEMHELARQSGETVQICGRDQDMMVVLAMEDGSGQFHVSSRAGSRSRLAKAIARTPVPVPTSSNTRGRRRLSTLSMASRHPVVVS